MAEETTPTPEPTVNASCRFCNKQAVEIKTRPNSDQFGLCADHVATYDAQTDKIGGA